MTIEKTIQARQTTKGLRIWLEGNDLIAAQFCHAARYTVIFADNCIELHRVHDGKRKVAGNQHRPVIDLQSNKLNKVFSEGTVSVSFGHGLITIKQV